MANIAVIGLCGASHFMKVDHFHKMGETLIANSYEKEYGGKGMNQAVAAARMGAKVSYLGASTQGWQLKTDTPPLPTY